MFSNLFSGLAPFAFGKFRALLLRLAFREFRLLEFVGEFLIGFILVTVGLF
jgi:hypothetical protein